MIVTDRYRAVFDATPTALLVTDLNLKVIDANAAAAQLFDVDSSFLAGKLLPAYIEPSERRTFRHWIRRHADGTQAASLNLTMRRRSGVPFSAVLDAFRGPDEIYWTVSDRTADAQNEERLWELNADVGTKVLEQVAERDAILEQLPVGVALVHRGGKLGWHNAKARAICGDELEPVLAAAAPVARALTGGSAETVRVTLGREGGPTVEIGAAPVPGGSAAAVIEDVSLREHAERASAEFVQNAAHELRTPVAAIASSVAALEAGAHEDAAERQRFLGHVARGSDRLGRIVDALLTLASLERGTGRSLIEAVPLGSFLDEVVGRISPAVTIDCAPGAAVLADRDLLAQAVGNVVGNAVEHAGAENVTVSAELHEKTVRIEVADTGPGISPEVRERIFERFFRAPGGERSGSGLGLAIAQAATAASNGRLELLPARAGEGARFRFTLPGARAL